MGRGALIPQKTGGHQLLFQMSVQKLVNFRKPVNMTESARLLFRRIKAPPRIFPLYSDVPTFNVRLKLTS